MGKKPWRKFAAEITQHVADDHSRIKSELERWSKKSEREEYWPMLLAYDATIGGKNWRYISMEKNATDDEQKAFYEAILKLPWLAPDVRRDVMKRVGRSMRKQTADRNAASAATYMVMIEWRKESMRIRGERGRIHDRALERVAYGAGMEPDNLKKFIQRHGPKGDKRKAIQESGRQWARRKSDA